MEKVSVNRNQEHNAVLKLLRNVPWEYADTEVPVDYRLGRSTGILFLSVKYHRLHPNYIYERLRSIPKEKYRLQIILLFLDDQNINWSRSDRTVREITRTSLLLSWTVLLAWSAEEAARWIESLHSTQHRTAAILREKSVGGWSCECVLRELDCINRTDAERVLAAADGSLRGVALLDSSKVHALRGFGGKKTDAFMHSLDSPFIVDQKHQ